MTNLYLTYSLKISIHTTFNHQKNLRNNDLTPLPRVMRIPNSFARFDEWCMLTDLYSNLHVRVQTNRMQLGSSVFTTTG